jgi:hypothetical protein
MPVRPAAATADPDVVAPQERGRARRTMPKSAPSRELQAGDLVCGQCGEANLPTRRFCSRCGNEMDGAEVVRAKWWRRILPKRKPRAARAVEPESGVAKTGQRRQHKRSVFPVIRRMVAVILLVGGIVYGLVPVVRETVNAQARSAYERAHGLVTSKYVPVSAVSATAKPVVKGHDASAAVDGHTNTYWSTPVNGPKRLTLNFQEPVELTRVLIHSGIVGDLRKSQRPSILHLVYPTGEGQDLELLDKTEQQQFPLDSHGKVTSVEIYVRDQYANVESKQVAITEIELFTTK